MADSSSTELTTTAGLNGGLSESRIVGGSFVAFFFVGTLFFASVIEQILAWRRWSDSAILGTPLTVSTLVAAVISAVIACICYFNGKVHDASMRVATELRRVTWPTRAETKVSTVAVIVVSIIAALILFFFDFVSAKVMSDWIPALLNKVVGA